MPEFSETIECAIEYGRAEAQAKIVHVGGLIGGIAAIGIGIKALKDGYQPTDFNLLLISGSALVSSISGMVAASGNKRSSLNKLNSSVNTPN